MAILPQYQQGRSPIEAIANALNVVNQVTGIKANSLALEKAKADMAAQEEARNASKQGIINKSDLLKSIDNYERTTADDKEGIPFKVQNGESVEDVFLKPKKKASDLLDAIAKGLNIQKTQGEIADKARERGSDKAKYEALPIESQQVIKDVAAKNANITSIKNNIDSALQILNDSNVSEEQKIASGRALLKTLNSAQGQDAVGAEEAKRLGSFLEFKIANFTQPGSFVGRDLDQFISQTALKSQELGQTLARNSATIDQLYGRPAKSLPGIEVPPSAQSKKTGGLINEAQAGGARAKLTPHDIEALKWLKANPNDPDAPSVRATLKGKGL